MWLLSSILLGWPALHLKNDFMCILIFESHHIAYIMARGIKGTSSVRCNV